MFQYPIENKDPKYPYWVSKVSYSIAMIIVAQTAKCYSVSHKSSEGSGGVRNSK